MQKDADSGGLQPGPAGDHSNAGLWRPWKKGDVDTSASMTNRARHEGPPDAKQKTPQVSHPVKLFWPKSRCFDYLYRDAEILLRNYPVQATICPFEESSSEEEEEEEEEEEQEEEKEQN
ncbi:hypothetical protein OJAV_G00229260 [Oryzias javanicus]|uniref:Protein ripply2 n=1 Tax=Oryzias javanicus TaxID=123683 RepID=A0A3S2TUP9_ORYJA|nr:hypothetical protein OJAV_G00229260 [Oryzias javanicus]